MLDDDGHPDISDENSAPHAHITQWYKCASCENLHVRLLDERGCLIAVVTVDRKMLADMAATLDRPDHGETVQ